MDPHEVSRIVCNEVYYTNALILLVEIMLCSKLHCVRIFKMKSPSCNITCESNWGSGPSRMGIEERVLSTIVDKQPGRRGFEAEISQRRARRVHDIGVSVPLRFGRRRIFESMSDSQPERTERGRAWRRLEAPSVLIRVRSALFRFTMRSSRSNLLLKMSCEEAASRRQTIL